MDVISLADTFTIFKDIVLITCSIIGARVAILGLATWKRQLDGNSRYSLAKNILVGLYELRSGITSVRSPLIEYYPAKDEVDKRIADWKGLAEAYQKKWDRVTVPQDKLSALFYEITVIEGEAFLELERQNLQTLLNDLYLGIKRYLDQSHPDRRCETTFDDKLLYGTNDLNDEFSSRLLTVIGQFESKLKPWIKTFHNLPSSQNNRISKKFPRTN